MFGAAVPERNPRTRTSRAVKLRAIGDLGSRNAVRAEYRYFWDTWGVKAHTVEAGYSRYFGDHWLADAFVRFNSQKAALFYSDNAQSETLYVSRNRQLSTFTSVGLGGKLTYVYRQVPGQYEIKLNGAYELIRFKYSDFTDLRTGQSYSFDANVLQLTCRPPSRETDHVHDTLQTSCGRPGAAAADRSVGGRCHGGRSGQAGGHASGGGPGCAFAGHHAAGAGTCGGCGVSCRCGQRRRQPAATRSTTASRTSRAT